MFVFFSVKTEPNEFFFNLNNIYAIKLLDIVPGNLVVVELFGSVARVRDKFIEIRKNQHTWMTYPDHTLDINKFLSLSARSQSSIKCRSRTGSGVKRKLRSLTTVSICPCSASSTALARPI